MVVKVGHLADEVETLSAGKAKDFVVDRNSLSIGLIAAVLGVLGLAGLLLVRTVPSNPTNAPAEMTLNLVCHAASQLLRLAAVHYEVNKRAKQEALRMASSLNKAELAALQSELADEARTRTESAPRRACLASRCDPTSKLQDSIARVLAADAP